MTAIAIHGTEVPAVGAWKIDPAHTEVGFVGRHFGISRIRGRFVGVDGGVTVADELSRSHVEVVIDMASVSSGDTSRDDHLRSPDFFDVERHPTATYRSTALEVDGARGTMRGDLTLKGITRPIGLTVVFRGQTVDPWGNERAVFSASGTIDREDWGLTWNMVLEAGGLLVSKEIGLEIEAELVRPPAGDP